MQGFTCLLVALLLPSCSGPRQVVTLADSLELPAGQSVELRAPEPLRTPAYSRAGDVCLSLPSPLVQDSIGFAIRTARGERVVPTAVAVRADGHADTLVSTYYLGPAMFCLSAMSDPTLHPPFASVRLESPVSLHLGKVTWLSTDK